VIPEDVNWIGVLDELNILGWNDSSIDLACQFTPGYVAQLRCGNIEKVGYDKGSKMINLLDYGMRGDRWEL